MEILDAQVHSWMADRPSRPWVESYRRDHVNLVRNLVHAGQTMTPEQVLVEMAEAGVDGAALTPVGTYGSDNSFELDAAEKYPRRFCAVGWVDALAPDLEDRLVADLKRGMLGIRCPYMRDPMRQERHEFDNLLKVCSKLGVPISLSILHPIHPQIVQMFKDYDRIQFFVDHVGVGFAPPVQGLETDDPFANIAAVADLAKYPNVNLKLTGAPAISQTRYPFPDLWDPIRRLIDAFSVGRIAWGSDFTRASGLVSYWSQANYLREFPDLNQAELEQLYGKTLRRVLRWNPMD